MVGTLLPPSPGCQAACTSLSPGSSLWPHPSLSQLQVCMEPCQLKGSPVYSPGERDPMFGDTHALGDLYLLHPLTRSKWNSP